MRLRLGIKPAELVELAHELWDRGLTAERDRRLLEQRGKGEMSKSARQALRGHVTRRLIEELVEELAEWRARRLEKGREAARVFDELERLMPGVTTVKRGKQP